MLKLQLYTKPICGLCDDLKAELAALAPTYPHQLEEVNIEEDAELFERFRYTIPVLAFEQDERHETLSAPISRADLMKMFRSFSHSNEVVIERE